MPERRRNNPSHRLVAIAIATALAAVLWLLGDISWPWGLAAVAGVSAWAALWPRSSHEAAQEAGERSRSAEIAPAELPPGFWHAVLGGILDPALVLDGRGHVLATNAAAVALAPIAIGQHLTRAYRSPELLGAVERAVATGSQQDCETRLLAPVERLLSGVVTPLGYAAGSRSGPVLLLVLRDQTGESELARLRTDFIANASHELRTPLASLKGFIETLQGSAKDDAVARQRFLAIMQEQAERMARLINDLLSLNRVEMRERVPPSEPVELAEVVETAIKAMQVLAEPAGIALSFTHLAGGAVVLGDRDELGQVAQNLIQNAIKYGRRGGRVDVALRRNGARVALAVADDGIGIPPQHLPRLTERFYRVSAKESRDRGGTGLGLAIVKHIVNRHRGELSITSELGKGSTFTVHLPAAGPSAGGSTAVSLKG